MALPGGQIMPLLDFKRPYGPNIIFYSPVCSGQIDRRQPAGWFNPVPPRLCHEIWVVFGYLI